MWSEICEVYSPNAEKEILYTNKNRDCTNIKLTGRIIKCDNGSEASLIIPIGNYNIMILSDDSCGVGKGEILRSELIVYHKNKNPSDNINRNIFGEDFVIADSETLHEAMQYCQRRLRKSID